MDHASLGSRMTPFRIAVVYVALGAVWIVLPEFVAFTRAASPLVRSEVQTVTGAAFVAVSGGLIYALTRSSRARHRATKADLESRTRETHVLHRILRHNIRNKCNIIAGHAERIADDERAAVIVEQTAEMIELSEKSRLLREVSREERQPVEVDLSAAVASAVADATGDHPDTAVRVDCPAGVRVLAHPDIERAVRELVVNALKHGAPPVSVAVLHEAGEVTVRVSDHGEGLPETERDVLEGGFRETQTYHSRGLGLWLVRYLVAESDGAVSVAADDDDGTTVRLTLRPSESAVVDWFLR